MPPCTCAEKFKENALETALFWLELLSDFRHCRRFSVRGKDGSCWTILPKIGYKSTGESYFNYWASKPCENRYCRVVDADVHTYYFFE